MRQIWYLVGWGHQFVTPCLTQLAFPQVYIGLYSLPRRRWLFIYKWGCVSSFLLYLSELSFVIGITAEKINTATDNIYPQFLVGLPCKPGSPVKIPAIALGAIFFFPGDLRSTSQPGWSLQMSNEEELQNNFSLLPMVTWPGPFQCWLETLNTSKTKPVSIASGPTFDQIAWICTIPTSKSTGRLSIPLWLSVSHQNEHQVSLLPKHLLSLPRGSHVPLSPQNCASQLWPWQRGFFPHVYIHKGKFSPVVEKMNLT